MIIVHGKCTIKLERTKYSLRFVNTDTSKCLNKFWILYLKNYYQGTATTECPPETII